MYTRFFLKDKNLPENFSHSYKSVKFLITWGLYTIMNTNWSSSMPQTAQL